MAIRRIFVSCISVLVCAFSALPCRATPEEALVQQHYGRNPVFAVPAELRPRVNFWLDIFTRYGKDHAVIHHREFPQAVFTVLDFSRESGELSPVQYEKMREQRIHAVTQQIIDVIRRLAAGDRVQGDFERHIEDAMRLVPDRDKYKKILDDNELIRSQTGIRERCADALANSGMYLPEIERVFVHEFGLPIELTRLPFIESSFDYRAYSSVGAAGIWQLMPRTGRLYLTVSRVVDQRRDPISATYAAARYLQAAHEDLGSWPLAITAYNNGNSGVARRVRDFGTADIVRLVEHPGDRPFGFASTNFYPEFLAALEVFDNPHRYFPEVRISAPIQAVTKKLDTAMPISQVAQRLSVPVSTLRELNLALADGVWTGRYSVPRGYEVRVPKRAAVAVASLAVEAESTPTPAAHSNVAYAASYYRVKKGDSLESIAKHYKTSAGKLRKLNELTSNNIRIGQQIAVAESGLAREAKKAITASTSERASYTVQSGDSLHRIASKFHISVAQIRELNHLSSTKLKLGQTLVIERKGGSRSGDKGK